MAPSPKRVLNNWTEVQRTALYLLNTHATFTSIDMTTRTRIFNFMFEDEIKASGLRHGLGEVALHSQYRDRTRANREHLWTNILRDRQTDAEEREREDLIEQIDKAAVTLGMVATESTLNTAREADNAELPDRDDENEDSELAAPTNKARMSVMAPSEGVLEMLHYKDLSWTANRPSIGSLHDALIQCSSPIYKHGGQVHRVAIGSDNPEADYMVCDATICTNCSGSANPTLPSQTEGLPFVHSSDTFMDDKMTYFQSKPRAQMSERPKHFLRHVQFKSMNGEVKCWVRICGNIGCRVCMHGNVQRNPHLAKRFVWDGDTSGEDRSEESEGGDALTEVEGVDAVDE